MTLHQHAETITKQHWAIRLRRHLLIPGSHRWNAWLRDLTAKLER